MIAPLLIVQRVANQSALTNHSFTTSTSSFNVRGQGELTGGDGIPLGGYPKNPVAGYGKTPDELGTAVEKSTDFHPDGKV